MKELLTQTASVGGGILPTGQTVIAPTQAGSTAVPPAQPTQQAPQATAVPYATSTPGRPGTYVLQKFEFPYCIARRFNVDAADLLRVNGLSTGSIVQPGQSLTIPQSGSWSQGARALRSHPAQYTVVGGDTIHKIACAFGDADPNLIIAANGLSSPYSLTAGQVLTIP